MRINYNVSAMLVNNKLANSENLLSKSLERLSSGLKINSAKDNPAGLAIAKRMNSQLESLSVATQSAGDGVSIIETADGALSEISDMLQRMNELAIKSANGINSVNDRKIIQDEVRQLTEEITRIAEATEFNGQKLLNGEFSLKGYTNQLDVKVSSYSSDVTADLYQLDSLEITKTRMVVMDEEGNPELDENGDIWTDEHGVPILVTKKDKYGNPVLDEDGNEIKEQVKVKIIDVYNAVIPEGAAHGNFPKGDLTADVKDDLVTIKGANGFEIVLDLKAYGFGDSSNWDAVNGGKWAKWGYGKPIDIVTTDFEGNDSKSAPLEIDATGIGAMILQVGANEGQTMDIDIPRISLKNMGLENLYVKDDKTGAEVWTLDVGTPNTAREAIDRISGAIQYVSSVRGRLGAYQNRLESTINSLNVTTENMTAAYSRIMDIDMAEEMTNYTTYQVLTQAGTSMLAQANERPSQVLQLLQ